MRFIHLADVHLGAKPEQQYSWSAKRGQEIWDTFRQVIEQAGRQQTDLLLIAGDLFHGQPLLRELKEVNYLFSSIPDTRVVLIAGNHDYLRKGSPYQKFKWSSNVYFLKEDRMERVEFPEIHTYVYGFSYLLQQISQERYADVRPKEERGCHILLAHGGDSQHIPIRYGALMQAGFTYVALGHIHQPQILSRTPEHAMAYAGSLEPVEKHEEGPHGFFEGEWRQGQLKIRLVPAASRIYDTIECVVDEDTGQYEAEQMVRDLIEKKGAQNMYHILLGGQKSPDWEIDRERFYALGRIVDVWDKTRNAYDLDRLEEQFSGTLIGEYIHSFRGRDLTEIERKALDYGLAALLETRE